MSNGFFRRGGTQLPTLEFFRNLDWNYFDSCVANPTTDLITVASANDFIIGEERVKFATTGVLPSPLDPDVIYYVINDGLTSTTLKVSLTLNGVAVNITGTGSGIHFLLTRSFLSFGQTVVANAGTDQLSLNPPEAHFLKPPNRVRFTTNGTLPPPLVVGTDYFVVASGLTDVLFKVALNGALNPPVDITGAGTGQHFVSVIGGGIWGVQSALGVLGAFVDESYYYLCGVDLFGCGSGGPGAAGNQQPIEIDRPPKIFFQSKDITDLVRRARDASSMIENLKIVGKDVSGNPKDGFMIN